MVHRNADMAHLFRENIRGGIGKVETDVVFKGDELLGKATLFNRMCIKPGSTIGEHAHDSDAEIYYVLSGEIVGYDDGEPIVMTAGDAMFTGGGHRHSLANQSDGDAYVLAIVIA